MGGGGAVEFPGKLFSGNILTFFKIIKLFCNLGFSSGSASCKDYFIFLSFFPFYCMFLSLSSNFLFSRTFINTFTIRKLNCKCFVKVSCLLHTQQCCDSQLGQKRASVAFCHNNHGDKTPCRHGNRSSQDITCGV